MYILQICHVIIFDDTDDGRDTTEDDTLDDNDDDVALGQWPETWGGHRCPDDEQRAIHTQIWRALQVNKNYSEISIYLSKSQSNCEQIVLDAMCRGCMYVCLIDLEYGIQRHQVMIYTGCLDIREDRCTPIDLIAWF